MGLIIKYTGKGSLFEYQRKGLVEVLMGAQRGERRRGVGQAPILEVYIIKIATHWHHYYRT